MSRIRPLGFESPLAGVATPAALDLSRSTMQSPVLSLDIFASIRMLVNSERDGCRIYSRPGKTPGRMHT